jgi:hypothetical protein
MPEEVFPCAYIDTGSEATFVGAGDTNFAISDQQTAKSLRSC